MSSRKTLEVIMNRKPYCFTANMRYKNITIFILIIVYIVLGAYSINDLRKNPNRRKNDYK